MRSPASRGRRALDGLRADVAGLALRVVRAFRDRDRDRVLVLFLGMALFRAAAALDLIADLLMAALPVPFLALPPTVARLAVAALLRPQVWERDSAGAAAFDELHVRQPQCF